MTHATCRLTAKNRDQLRNPTLGNRVWATFTFTFVALLYRLLSACLQPLSNQSARQGDRVTLECAVPAYPAPDRVQWFRNEIEIFSSPDYTISFSLGTATLVIAEVFPEDAGTYRCMITVNDVPNSTSMYLQVAGQQ